jgi:hypothetical protein
MGQGGVDQDLGLSLQDIKGGRSRFPLPADEIAAAEFAEDDRSQIFFQEGLRNSLKDRNLEEGLQGKRLALF